MYRAKDTKLDRDVAIKVLPTELARDKERLTRFDREAKLLAQLNHANIATIHGLEELEGQPLLIMELVEGETLAERVARGPIPIDEAIPIYIQIAEGLEAAHDKGIIHRDLKPANVMITPGEQVKILDFGLAKAFHDEPGLSDDASQSPTVTKGTALGVILGTASYMSPEQARGKQLDKRSDLWAFGCCLYEALVGRKAFVGETTTDTLAAIVNTEPNWGKLPVTTPASVRRLLRRCLAKNTHDRLGDASTARLELTEPATADRTATVGARLWQRPEVLPLAGVLIAAAAAALAWSLRPPAAPEVRRVGITLPDGFSIDASADRADIDISPDGKWVAYVATDTQGDKQLFVRGINDFNASPVDSTSTNPRSPRFTADSQWLGYSDPASGRILRVPTSGSRAETTACDTETLGVLGFSGFDWDGNGGVFYSRRTEGLWHCRAGGSEPLRLTSVDGDRGLFAHSAPRLLPGGSALVFAVRTGEGELELAVVEIESGEWRLLGVTGTAPRYIPTGHLLIAREGTLQAIRFDVATLNVLGEPFPVLSGVATKMEAADFAVADDGTLAYVPGSHVFGEWNRSLVWVGRDGRTERVGAQPMPYQRLQIAPDGSRVALETRTSSADVWVWDFERATLTRVTFGPAIEGFPVWVDDARLLFESHRVPQGNVHEKAADGTGTTTRVVESPNHQIPAAVSPDGKWYVLEERIGGAGNEDLALFSRDTGVVEPLLATGFEESNASISPDGRWMAYESDESGQLEVYVRPFPEVEDGKWPVTSTGGSHPVWSRDGSELFFLDAEGRLSAVDVRAGSGFTTGRPEPILDRAFFVTGNGQAYDVSPDGERFLMIEEDRSERDAPTEVRLILNWLEEFERLAAAVR